MTTTSMAAITTLALVLAGPAQAATPINETRPLVADGRVEIENVRGRIVVRTWAQPQVKITGSLGKGAEKLLIEGDASSLRIQVKYPGNGNGNWLGWGNNDKHGEPSILEVTIPKRASLDIDSVSADVDVQQMAGRKLDIDSVSGNVQVTASSPGEASFENVSGDTSLRITSDKVSVDSVSGDIDLRGGLRGEVRLESVSGNVLLTAPSLSRLTVSSVSGDASLHTGLAANGLIKTESVSGSLDLYLPETTSAQLEVETFSGDIVSPAGHVETEEYGPGKSLNARLGQGKGQIQIESFSGDVRLYLQ